MQGDGRASLFALDTLADQKIEATSGEEKDNELDELDDDLDADDMIDDDLEDEASAGQSAEFSQPLSSKAVNLLPLCLFFSLMETFQYSDDM